ncbi:MAG: chorismate synthase [Clostridia bacterium]|nr:chorismate synthase [Clostridia bacterium]
MATWKGNNISVSLFGTSHAQRVGVEICGLPKESFNEQTLSEFLKRRSPSNASFSTKRIEADIPTFLEGVENESVVADKVVAAIANTNVKSGDYTSLLGKPRPSHADYAAYAKDGRTNFSGGGEFSGRLTAPLCVAGGIAKQMLEKRGIFIHAYLSSVGGIKGKSYKTSVIMQEDFSTDLSFPALSQSEKMLERIDLARKNGDSVGGIIECIVFGMPAGIGAEPPCGLEGKIASLLYGIPAVKGVEFGNGFDLADRFGSTANDCFVYENESVKTLTNRSGGINGGISNGMPITFSVAFRPTPSISKPQQTVDLLQKKPVEIRIEGRHDACIVPRAVPVVEAVAAIAILDEILS